MVFVTAEIPLLHVLLVKRMYFLYLFQALLPSLGEHFVFCRHSHAHGEPVIIHNIVFVRQGQCQGQDLAEV